MSVSCHIAHELRATPSHRDKPEPDPEAQNYLYVCICYFTSNLFLLLDGTVPVIICWLYCVLRCHRHPINV